MILLMLSFGKASKNTHNKYFFLYKDWLCLYFILNVKLTLINL